MKKPLLSLCLSVVFFSSVGTAKVSPAVERGQKAFEAGQYRRAVGYLDQAVSGAKNVSERNLAYYYMGLSLYELGHYFSAYRAFRMVLLKPDPANKKVYGKAIKNAVLIMDRLGVVDRVGKLLIALPPAYVPSSVADLVQYATGVYYFYYNQGSKAEARLKSVHPESPVYAKAMFHLGVLATKRKDYKESVFYFNKVAQLTLGRKDQDVLHDLAKLNLARSLYSAGRLEASIEAYARFTNASPFWLTILLEASWPLMRMNDTTVSLGNLHTLTSPFYRETLVGEGYVLKATILFALCKYEEMRKTLNQFFEIYDPVLQAMQKERNILDSPRAFFNGYTQNGSLNRAFVSFVDLDPGIKQDLKLRDMLRRERMELSRFPRNQTISGIKEKLDNIVDFIALRVGKHLQAMHRRKFDQLREQREQANYLKVEIITGEKELIEKSKGLPAKRITEVETKIFAGYHYWPFKGEFWEDELGSYVYTTESSCVD